MLNKGQHDSYEDIWIPYQACKSLEESNISEKAVKNRRIFHFLKGWWRCIEGWWWSVYGGIDSVFIVDNSAIF